VASLDRDDPVLPFVLMGTDTVRYRAHLPVADWLFGDLELIATARDTRNNCFLRRLFPFPRSECASRKLPPLSPLFGKASWLVMSM